MAAGIVIVAGHLAGATTASASPPIPPVPTVGIPVEGACSFGTNSSTQLTATFSPDLARSTGGLSGLSGTGSCTTNLGASLAYPDFSLSGLWTCQGGVASGAGNIAWSNPAILSVSSATITAVGGPGTITIWVRDPTLGFQAVGTFAWAHPGHLSTCETSGGIGQESLVGAFTFIWT